MSASSRDRKNPKSEIDISTHRSAPGLGWRATVLIYGNVFTIALAMFYFQASLGWIAAVLVATTVVAIAGYLAWVLIVRRGVFTWGSLALLPAKLMARGDTAGAMAAYKRAVARARQFPADDHRRGLMLCELAMFIKHQGRYPEAIVLFEESVGIMNQLRDTYPLDYFVVLNNYSICSIHLRDYAAAQRILEQAIDLTLAVKKREEGIIARAPVQQVQAIQFVLHLNLAFLLIEMGELQEAERQLEAVDSLRPLLGKRFLKLYGDHHVTISALWAYEAGHFADAETEVANAQNADYPGLLRVRANLRRLCGDFAEAERLLRLHQVDERKKGLLHRPELLKSNVDLAECLFAQGKHEEAFATLQEAHALVVDYGLPMDAYWRRVVQSWLSQATQLGRADLVAILNKEMARVSVTANQAITILDKFRALS